MSTTKITDSQQIARCRKPSKNTARIGHMNKRFAATTGKRVKLLREDFGWKQEYLADLLEKQYEVKIGQSYLSHMENDRTKPTGVVIAALARALKTTSDYLLLLTDDSERPGDCFVAISEEADEAAAIIDGLPPSDRAKSLQAVQAIEADYKLAQQQFAEVESLIHSIEIECGHKGAQLLERFFENRIRFNGIGLARHKPRNNVEVVQ